MNVSELSRKLRVNTKELLEVLPGFGFDVGKKAIKFDDKIARKIIYIGEEIREKIEADKQAKLDEFKILNEGPNVVQEITEAEMPSVVTVRDFATILNRPVNEVIKELMKNGVLASLNERIDFETASIVADEFGVKLSLTEEIKDIPKRSLKIKQIIEKEEKSDLQARAPVIVVMGHVDHGKTKLLDAIRKTDVVAGEAGGITQHIGAYQVHKKDTLITFIDTPGHEAFTAMRSRGAKIADVAILVVAANDSIKPQTVEAIKIIQQSEIPMVVAINKIDLPESNIEKVKQDLASMNLNPEDWGGDTIIVPISAKENQNIDDLLDTILLVAELEKEKIMANPNKEAVGTIIESHIDKGEGPVATVLIQNGTLKKGDNLTINGEFYGKARSLKDYTNKDIVEASPSVPVKIIGLKYAPKVGDIVEVTKKIERKHKKTKEFQIQKDETVISSFAQIQNEDEESKVTKVNLIIKTDVLRSLEAISESLEKIESEEIKVKIISKGLGNITDADVDLALSSEAMLIGFNVKPISSADELAREKGLEIKYYDIIYKLIEDVKAQMSQQLSPEIVREDLGKLKVLAIFKVEPKNVVLGGKVTKGKIVNKGKVEVLRDKEIIATAEIAQLQAGKQDVNEVLEDQECGINLTTKKEIKEGDILQVYQEQSISKIL